MMMKYFIIIFLFLLSLGKSLAEEQTTPINDDTVDNSAPERFVKRGLHGYLLFDQGFGWLQTQLLSDLYSDYNTSSGGYTWRLGGGFAYYYKGFSYGLETAYHHIPSNKYVYKSFSSSPETVASLEGQSVDILAVITAFLNDRFYLKFKTGAGAVTEKFHYDDNQGRAYTLKSYYVTPEFTFETGFFMTKHFAMNLAYQHLLGNPLSDDIIEGKKTTSDFKVGSGSFTIGFIGLF